MDAKQIGLSPKLIGAVLAVVVGVILYLTDNHEVGLSVTLAGLGALGVGYAVGPGTIHIEAPVEEGDDTPSNRSDVP